MAEKSIYQLLEHDHREVEGLFKKILGGQRAGGGSEGLFEQLSTELLVHMEAEEKTFYKELQNTAEGRELVSEGLKEHKEGQKILNQAKQASSASAEWKAKVQELQKAIDHHVKEEEGKIFSAARKTMDGKKAEQIGKDFSEQKEILKK